MEYPIETRKAKILELLAENGKVRVRELSAMFGISEVTARFDLEALETEGLLRRVHGGAVASSQNYYNLSVRQRMKTNELEKTAIAARVAEEICDNDTVLMNSGTSVLFVLRAIKKKKNICIVTNSITVAAEAAGLSAFRVILLGGAVDSEYRFTHGMDTIRALSAYHADKLVLSIDGATATGGYTTYYNDEAELSREMLEHADTTIVAADSSKIGRTAFAQISPVERADILITDASAPEGALRAISSRGVEVITVDTKKI